MDKTSVEASCLEQPDIATSQGVVNGVVSHETLLSKVFSCRDRRLYPGLGQIGNQSNQLDHTLSASISSQAKRQKTNLKKVEDVRNWMLIAMGFILMQPGLICALVMTFICLGAVCHNLHLFLSSSEIKSDLILVISYQEKKLKSGIDKQKCSKKYMFGSGMKDNHTSCVSHLRIRIDHFLVRCAMALVHQRIRRIFYAFPNPNAGALGSVHRLQGEKSLNHHYAVFRVSLPEEILDGGGLFGCALMVNLGPLQPIDAFLAWEEI
ncbi:hypothetical protein CK203_039275 [Vitis vinifera]|uniref:Uncharacterized protein n=1 Tax=Vitis vinifera TaxID=29760 RepID=A0A438HGJ2_VITVI|nr:hypothetical protein CK203_039275 [Vitis vinifera]